MVLSFFHSSGRIVCLFVCLFVFFVSLLCLFVSFVRFFVPLKAEPDFANNFCFKFQEINETSKKLVQSETSLEMQIKVFSSRFLSFLDLLATGKIFQPKFIIKLPFTSPATNSIFESILFLRARLLEN